MSRPEALRQLCLSALIAGLCFSAAVSTHVTAAPLEANSAPISDHAVLTLESSGIYIVQLAEPSLAQYRGEVAGLPAAKRVAERGNRLDAKSSEAKAYVNYLQGRQDDFLADITGSNATKSASEPAKVLRRFHHAFNGLTLKLSPEQLAAVRAHPSVKLIEPLAAYPLLTDDGPRFIGAPGLWDGSANGGDGSRGEGVVIGIIDSGVNWPHPSFAAQDGDGFNHTNPNGAGVYFGLCDTTDVGNPAPDPDLGPACNDKVIGAWDMAFDLVQQVNAACAVPSPPSFCAQLGVPLTDFDNALDENGHGTHTASTSGGNRIDAGFLANDLSISGVAPRANLVIYDTCHTNVNGQGSCLNDATLAAINQAVADGVDVINYSIGGGSQPWNQSGALAFLAAADAGIVVAASAGNSGPTASTVAHLEPWVMTVASGTHERGTFGALNFSVTGPGMPPAGIVDQPVLIGTAGILWTPSLPPSTPLIVSPGIDSADDGCAAFAPDQFLGAAALIRRGTCSFSQKIANTQAAGAIAMIIANNQAGDIGPGQTPGSALGDIPAFGLTQVRADAVRDFVAGLGNPTDATIAIQGVVNPRAGDVMSGFSSRGPSNLEMIKPDVMGPGSNILAAYVGGPTALNAISGTSMSSPHLAGAAALLRALKPSWTPMEIKSALMMTAKSSGILKENGSTPADPFDTGAGRVDLSRAARAGLVMDEVEANFQAANPALGGDPSALNIPSLKSFACVDSCSWTRTFRSPLTDSQDWEFAFTAPPGVTIAASPSSFTLAAGATQVVEFTASFDFNAVAEGVWNFAEVQLIRALPRSGGVQVGTIVPVGVHMPVAVIPIETVPEIAVTPLIVDEQTSAGSPPIDVAVTITNDGAADLNWLESLTQDCGASWVSLDPDSGIVAAMDAVDVSLLLDPQGLAPGVYTATVCISSDAPANPLVEIGVSLEVLALEDIIFLDGFEPILPRPSAEAK